jgi:DNA-binding response OmpR family regulator
LAERILVVDDEPGIRDVLRAYLEQEYFTVRTAADGAAALSEAAGFQPHLVLLDLMLPELDGLEVCRRLRADFPTTYVIMLTVKAAETDKLVGLGLGADDYITKPFSPREVVARVKAVLRRAREQNASPTALTFPGLSIDPLRRQVLRNDAPVGLTAREFDLLLFLARHPDQVFTREQLLDHIWGYTFPGGTRTVDVHLGNLRRKLEDDPGHPRYLQTLRGVGYRFVRDPA